MRCEIAEGIRKIDHPTIAELNSAMVGFDFTLTMTENDDASSGVYRAPKMALPTRTWVAPNCTAVS